MLKQYYQHCVVPYCKNNRRNAPDKLYIRVPYESKLRKQWLDLARRDRIFSPRSSLYFCEDHFDLPKDMENYVQFKVQGYINKIRMKKGCLPSKFDCQPGRKRIASSVSPESVKKQRKELIEQTLAEYDMKITKISEAGNSRICRTEPTSTLQVPLPYSSKSQESKKLETYVSIEPKKEPIELETEYVVPKEESTDLDPFVSLVPKEEPTDLDPLVSLENVDKCKCCLSEMELKTLWDQHEFEGDGEVYGEMLNECFGISFHQPDPSEQICEVCIVRLREALEFKKEILATQEMLQEGVQVVKEEVFDEELDDVSSTYETVEFIEEEDKSDDDYIPEDAPSSPEEPVPALRKTKYPKKLARSQRNKTYKQYTREDLQNAVWEVQNGGMSCVEAGRMYGVPKGTVLAKVNESMSESNNVDELKEITNDKFYNFVKEIQKLLTYTNAIPFRTRATRYYCFYCSTDGPLFEDPDELRSHTTTEHNKERITNIELYMKPQWMNEIIKFDITDLHCTECLLMLPDWNNMFVHFAETHDIGFDEAYTRVIPYSLTADLQCVLCRENFANYGLLDIHMNLHYSNHVCFKCGDTFLSVSRLDKHITTHKTGNFPCTKCDKSFSLNYYLTRHVNLVHNQKTPKCVYCKKNVEGPMHLHISEEHSEKVKPLTCEVCGKVFTWKPYFVAHMRRNHIGVKKYKCEHCPKKFIKPYELKTHSITHTRLSRLFECGACKATFNSITSIKKHISVHDKEK